MQAIADNNCYKISVNVSKNRLYLTLKGFWSSVKDVPDYLNHLKKAVGLLSKGYTILTDTTEMIAPPEEVGALHEKAQKIVMSAGLSYTAELVPRSVISRMAINKYSETSGMRKQMFATKSDAEAWLDGK